MKNVKWFAAIILAFVMGYIFRANYENAIVVPEEIIVVQKDAQMSTVHSCESMSAALKNIFAVKEDAASTASIRKKEDIYSSSFSSNPSVAAKELSSAEAEKSTQDQLSKHDQLSREISDEEIDALVPQPFAAHLKNMHGVLRERYKEFAQTNIEKKDEWDIDMQNKISNFLMSQPTSNQIKIDYIACNIGFCEIRITELKKFTIVGMMTEVLQQPWAEIIGENGTVKIDVNPTTGSGYMLLTR